MCVRAEGSGSCRLTFKRQEGFGVWSVDLVRREISHHTIGLANLLGHSCFCLFASTYSNPCGNFEASSNQRADY